MAIVTRLWRADLGVPFLYSGDANLVLMVIKGGLHDGWFLNNHDLGAPFGQQLQDYPVLSGDSLHLLGMKALGLFIDNYAAAVNVYYILGFPLTGVSAFAVFRALGVTRLTAIVCAVLFALLPYHFLVGEAAPFNATYFAIPPAC